MTPNSDPIILLSYINTKLRDHYPSLDTLCDDLSIDKEALIRRLSSINYEYDVNTNQFR